MSLSVNGWSLWVPLALLLCPEFLLLSWEGSGALQSFLPPLGPSSMISFGAFTDPGGWAEGTADGCPDFSGAWHAAPVATAGPPCRSALLAGLCGPCQSQGGRWAGSLGFGPREGPWWPGQCGRRRARQRFLSLHGAVAVPQTKGSGSSALSIFLVLFAHQLVRSLEPREEVIY